ncbi:tigger transposable element-derived protein 2-like [Topomyia yanbarensis]|uniref:tigger transposable element-derived protein 2-like n=1 Tax=Topomyia yanbarensis TaxID=2498891 RepID=UPI00273C6E36|nr:tigger transposable element-derived protein 2-like [Topomyia yanbarensis]
MDGSLKLPLMLIGKSKNPRTLKHVRQLPVYYAASKNAWMTQFLSKKWFLEEFVPRVTKFLQESNRPIEAVLVLDNCSAHFKGGELQTEDGKIWTEFLPPNTTAVVQPMDQNIIQMIKARYRKILMQEIMGRSGDFREHIKNINIKDAIFWVAQSWDYVPADAIRKSWDMLYNPVDCDDEDDLPLSVLQDKLRNISQKILEPRTQDEENDDVEFLKDDDIVERVLNPENDTNIYTGDDSTLPTIEEEGNFSVDVADENESVPVSHEAAINGLNLILRYAEENGWPLSSQFSLRQMRLGIFKTVTGDKSQ